MSKKQPPKIWPSDGRYSLFDEPTMRMLREQLSDKERQYYQQVGEHMFARMHVSDTESGETKVEMKVQQEDPVAKHKADLVSALRSGYHPSDMDDAEREFARKHLGERWYERFGYSESDLSR